MKKEYTGFEMALRLWFITALTFVVVAVSGVALREGVEYSPEFFIIVFASFIGSLPAFIVLWIALPIIRKLFFLKKVKHWLLVFLLGSIAFVYVGLLFALDGFNWAPNFFEVYAYSFSAIFGSSLIAFLFSIQKLNHYFYDTELNFSIFKTSKFKPNKMNSAIDTTTNGGNGNRILIKGLITGGLILLMMIPSIFIFNLVQERKDRQAEIVKEVSSKWAGAQKISGPFLSIPYVDTISNYDGKVTSQRTKLLVLPTKLEMDGSLTPEYRPRSIYKVMLYKSQSVFKGNFLPEFPQDINYANVDFANARLCFALSDFKGVEQEISASVNGKSVTLRPGLPVADFGDKGLSAPISLTSDDLKKGVSFELNAKLKGSEQLHYYPLAASGTYRLISPWPNPSFDGNALPGSKKVNDSSFAAEWTFNQGNLPFAPVLRAGTADTKNLPFGVTLVQPVDQYSKTMRSVKYSILFIGLTFALFFIIELLQNNPFHPVQYMLTGIALVVFYTLLLAVSEYILFDYAYAIAAFATIMLISLYAKGHFRSWKIASAFFAFLLLLYTFIYVLITLEDTALLVGSIGLFIVLALIMYASRRINWYGNKPATTPIES